MTNEDGAASEPKPSYETEVRHESVTQFKESMGAHIDNYMVNFVNK